MEDESASSPSTPEPADCGDCGDCAVAPGQPHTDGCDVARCTLCGWQRISCEHADDQGGWGQIWTGIWPGTVEATELGYWTLDLCHEGRGFVTCPAGTPGAQTDLNKLMSLARDGFLKWDGNRWQPDEKYREYLTKVATR